MKPPRGDRSSLSWERATTGFLHVIGLRNIRSKIIVFALLASLIPSVTMGWLSYVNNRKVLDEKIAQELTSLTSHVSRELDIWLKEHRYETKVFSSSYEVSENLEKWGGAGHGEALGRLEDYLRSVEKRFADYEELVVLDVDGQVVASSRERSATFSLPHGWIEDAREGRTVLGGAYQDEASGSEVLVLAEPIRTPAGTLLGALGVKVNFEEFDRILASYAEDPSLELYLMTAQGEMLISSEGPFEGQRLEAETARRLFTREMTPMEFRSVRGVEVLGALQRIPELNWGVVAHKNRAQAYAAIAKLRNVTLALIITVLSIICLAAYMLGLTIVRPLSRLTGGANKVSVGDLDVDLPVYGRSEVSYLTEVFNDMVTRLRKFREENIAINRKLRERNAELRQLSIVDGLTGLYNRTYLPEILAKELPRSERHSRSFSILMIDIDHFKRFNDTHGHQAGDELLVNVAKILKDSVRASDYAVRYGGEEFLVLITEAGPGGAWQLAETLRHAVEEMQLPRGQTVTISVGVASFPEHGEEAESIIREADAALYRCKRQGRNRVAVAKSPKKKRSEAASG